MYKNKFNIPGIIYYSAVFYWFAQLGRIIYSISK